MCFIKPYEKYILSKVMFTVFNSFHDECWSFLLENLHKAHKQELFPNLNMLYWVLGEILGP